MPSLSLYQVRKDRQLPECRSNVQERIPVVASRVKKLEPTPGEAKWPMSLA